MKSSSGRAAAIRFTTAPRFPALGVFSSVEDQAAIDAGAKELVHASRIRRLAEVRRRRGLTQRDVAGRMGVRQERVSAIERGKVSSAEVGTIAAYVAALGGELELVADFGDIRVVVG